MNDQGQIIAVLKEEFNRWEDVLAGLSEDQITARQLPADLSIKDVLAHLMAWQQVSIARLEAAQLNKEPDLPNWLAGSDPDSEEDLEQFNDRIHETYHQQPWSRVHQDWRDGFLRFLKLGAEVPDNDLWNTEKYPWLKGYSLFAVLQGSYEHHHDDHLEPLLLWLRQDRTLEFAQGEATMTETMQKHDLVITRVFDAPIELVWRAWTEPEHVMQWWGPTYFTCPSAEIDFREGGTSLVCMRAPKEFGGQDMYSTWAYIKIVPLERIEYIHNLADKDGNKVDPVDMGLPADFPQDQRHVVTFKALSDNRTELTVTEYSWTVGHMMEMSQMGMEQCLDKMVASFARV